MRSVTKILFVSADPSDAARLRLGEEMREVRQGLQLSRQREKFELAERHCLRPTDLTQAIFEVNPNIVHFSGHGMANGSVLLEDGHGNALPVAPDALEAVFELFSDTVNCVVLNACYSAVQAEAIARKIPYVVGMRDRIGDPAAIAFSVGFYRALANQRNTEDAFRFGLAELRLAGIDEHSTPALITSSSVRRRLTLREGVVQKLGGLEFEDPPTMAGRASIRITPAAQSPGMYVLVDPAAFGTFADLLDEIYLKCLAGRFLPYTYGERWLLVANEEFDATVLAPLAWVASDDQSVIKMAPEWRQRTPERLGLTAGSDWIVHEISGEEALLGIATNSIDILKAYDHAKSAYMVRDRVISIPLEAIENGHALSAYKYTRVIMTFWIEHQDRREILVDRPGGPDH